MKQALAEVRAGAQRAAQLLDSFLELARLERGQQVLEKTIFPVVELINSSVKSFEAQATVKRLYLQADVPADLHVHTDRAKLERVLFNLLDNAIKFTQRGSVRVSVETAGDDVEIHVIDTGVGIALENRERLFEEFFQVHNHERDRSKGFGLGLAIAHRLTRHLGGDLAVDSSLGNGSRFTILLPGIIVRGGNGQTLLAATRDRPAAAAASAAG